MNSSELPAAGAALAATAAPLIGHLTGAPWWLTVSLAATVTVLGAVYLLCQTWVAIERIRARLPDASSTTADALTLLRSIGANSLAPPAAPAELDDPPLRDRS
jgi:predicted signal transduction protein with EAL and GGDEF domain